MAYNTRLLELLILQLKHQQLQDTTYLVFVFSYDLAFIFDYKLIDKSLNQF